MKEFLSFLKIRVAMAHDFYYGALLRSFFKPCSTKIGNNILPIQWYENTSGYDTDLIKGTSLLMVLPSASLFRSETSSIMCLNTQRVSSVFCWLLFPSSCSEQHKLYFQLINSKNVDQIFALSNIGNHIFRRRFLTIYVCRSCWIF